MNKIWDRTKGVHVDIPDRMKKFIQDIDAVCMRHGLSIAHEDYYGNFIIEEYITANIDWLYEADKSYTDESNDSLR